MKLAHLHGHAAATSRVRFLPACSGVKGLPMLETAEIVLHWLARLSGLGVRHG